MIASYMKNPIQTQVKVTPAVSMEDNNNKHNGDTTSAQQNKA